MKLSRLSWYWTTTIIAVVILLSLILVAYLEDAFNQWDFWRVGLTAPSIIIYILLIYPFMWRLGERAIQAFRPLLSLEENAFNQIVLEINKTNRLRELAAALIGAVFWLVLSQPWIWVDQWIDTYEVVTSVLMFGLLGWLIYSSIIGSRSLSRLSSQPLKLDIFDTGQLIPIARSSLGVSFAFIGGISLSLVFQTQENLSEWNTITIYAVLVLATVLIFFLSMWSVHSAMAGAKRRELALVRKNLVDASRELKNRAAQGRLQGIKGLSSAIAAWITYERRVKEAPEWPFNAGIIRRLAASVLVPGVVYLIKIFSTLGFRLSL